MGVGHSIFSFFVMPLLGLGVGHWNFGFVWDLEIRIWIFLPVKTSAGISGDQKV